VIVEAKPQLWVWVATQGLETTYIIFETCLVLL